MSSDFQDPPELIPDYIKKWEEGNLVVLGQKTTSDENFLKHFLKKVFYKFINIISETPLMMNTTGAGIFDRKIFEYVSQIDEIEALLECIKRDYR